MTSDSLPAMDLPFLTTTPGIGGELKRCPEDFFVEEVPLYPTEGRGEFVFLLIEKRDLTTPQLVQHIARTLHISREEIGTAGRKDRQAITRQYVSVPLRALKAPRQLETDNIRVLTSHKHRNKLRTGHLAGNYFRIILRDVPEGGLAIAEETARQIAEYGIPNYYGEQRFGNAGTTDDSGFRILRGEAAQKVRKDELRFQLSAMQSRLFNCWASERITDGLARQVLEGDVMQVAQSGGCFTVTDVSAEQARADRREVWLTGPMFGPKMRKPTGVPADREQRILGQFGLDESSFDDFKKVIPGARRPLLVWPHELTISVVDAGLQFEFALPSGTYATTLLREFQKCDDRTSSNIESGSKPDPGQTDHCDMQQTDIDSDASSENA